MPSNTNDKHRNSTNGLGSFVYCILLLFKTEHKNNAEMAQELSAWQK